MGEKGLRLRGVVGLLRSVEGRGIVEYIVLAGCVAILAIGSWRLFGRGVAGMVQREAHDVETLNSDCPYCENGSEGSSGGSNPSPGGGGSQGGGRSSGTGARGPAATVPAGQGAHGAGGPVVLSVPAPSPPPPAAAAGGGPPAQASVAGPAASHGLPTWAQGAIGFGQGVLQGLAPGGWLTNFIPGLVPPELANSPAYRYWNGAGQVTAGIASAAAGAGEEVLGGALDVTGVGAAVGVPMNVVAAVQIANGVASVATGTAQMAAAAQQMQSQPSDSGGGGGGGSGGGGDSPGSGRGSGGGGPKKPADYVNNNPRATPDEVRVGQNLDAKAQAGELPGVQRVEGAAEIPGQRSGDYRMVNSDGTVASADLYQPQSGNPASIGSHIIDKSGQAKTVVVELGQGQSGGISSEAATQMARDVVDTPGHSVSRVIVLRSDGTVVADVAR